MFFSFSQLVGSSSQSRKIGFYFIGDNRWWLRGSLHVGVTVDSLTLSFSGGKRRACLAEETHGADLEAEPLVGFPKVIQHYVNDG